MLNSLEHVAFCILEDAAAAGSKFKRGTRYTPLQAIEVVCNRRKSVASCNTAAPSYLWTSLVLDEGALTLDTDFGLLAYMARDPANHRRYRTNWPKYEAAENSAVQPITGDWADEFDNRLEGWMLVNGLSIGQPFLVRSQFDSSVYDGEWDYWFTTEILYREPCGSPLWLPIYPA